MEESRSVTTRKVVEFGQISIFICLGLFLLLKKASENKPSQFDYTLETVLQAHSIVTCQHCGVTLEQDTYKNIPNIFFKASHVRRGDV